MTTYCNPGQKTKLYYRFDGDKGDKTQNFDDQISVTVTSSIATGTDFNPRGYKISVWLSDPLTQSVGGYGLRSFTARGYNIGTLNPNYGYPLSILNCDGTYSQVGFIRPEDIGKPITKDEAVTCSGVIEATETITVRDTRTGAIVFVATGKSPARYSVVCGDDCPPGHCKCPSPNYPGYCCLPCAQVAGELLAITAIARSKR
jgi:hypothetical protein